MSDYTGDFLSELKKSVVSERLSKDKIAKLKMKLGKKYGLKKIPSDIELLIAYDNKDYDVMKNFLFSKPTRDLSGVSVISIMTKPSNCPHGTCIMCPGGLKSSFGDVPKSYTGNEPATMRAIRNYFDPYLQVFNRLEQYILLGILPQKIEMIIMGGTFLWLSKSYKDDFIRLVYKAMNDFSDRFMKNGEIDLGKYKKFFEFPKKRDDSKRQDKIVRKILKLKESKSEFSMENEKLRNEKSNVRCVGLTIETKPDYGKLKHGNELLRYGCTRVELGVQSLFDKALKKMNRGHTLNDTVESIKQLRDLGFKLNFHVMLGCPGVTLAEEKNSLSKFFSDQRFRPDMVKIYPLMVMPGTGLEQLYNKGRYKPVDTETASKMIGHFKRYVKEYCRIMRVQRDIPPKYSVSGVDRSNLRQYVDRYIAEKGIECKCIRCREVGHASRKKSMDVLNPEIVVRRYEASDGIEYFISYEDTDQGVLLGFLRLRFPSESLRKEITSGSGLIRELHVYGHTVRIGKEGQEDLSQHRGVGKLLMEKAENIILKNKKDKIVVISGVGVREYYRKLGYELQGPYMVKKL